jgi:hypothetical protein
MPHPSLEAGQEDAAADRVNEKAVADALGNPLQMPHHCPALESSCEIVLWLTL